MMYHGLAIPFIAAVALYMMELFDVRPNFYSPVKWTLVPGAFLTGVSAMIFAGTAAYCLFLLIRVFGEKSS